MTEEERRKQRTESLEQQREDDAFRGRYEAARVGRVNSWLLMFRANGVRHAEFDMSDGCNSSRFVVDLAPMAGESADAAPNVPSDLGAGEKKCACGHLQDSEHLNGLCIAAACPASVCHPEATAKPNVM